MPIPSNYMWQNYLLDLGVVRLFDSLLSFLVESCTRSSPASLHPLDFLGTLVLMQIYLFVVSLFSN